MRVSNVTVRKRLVFILIVGILVFGIFVVRLGYVQLFMHDWLMKQAMNSWSREIPYEAERGDILDRNGEILATNQSRPSVLVIPKQVREPAKTAKILAKTLDADEQKIYKTITTKSSTNYIKAGRKISNELASKIKELNLPGIFIAEDFKRHYPKDRFLAHVLGFAGIDNQGLIGLESYYDDLLKGEKGHVDLYSDAHGERMSSLKDTYVPPKDGLNLMLTIDSRVQTIIERELDNAVQKYHPDNAIAIAMNPNTGEVLGMATRPDFDPENYKNISPKIYNHNLPIWRTYEPGSTFKVITLAAALNENLVNLKTDTFNDPGFIKVDDRTLHCWKRGGHGHETFLEVVENSCNPGFVKLGQKLGKDRLFSYIDKFGFGEKTGIDLQGEAKGILFDTETAKPINVATTAFGQGVAVTPIQQVTAVSAAVNGGYLYTPYIAKQWIDPYTGEVVSQNSPELKRQVISEETSKKVRQTLESVVAKGTGRNAYVDGWRIGGKTGTAQKIKPGGGYLENNYILSFMGFAPADDPQIVVYVAIDNPKGTVQFGGVVAAPIAGKIISDSLQALGVEKRTNGLEKEYRWGDKQLLEVPNLIGKTKREIAESYFNFKLDVNGDGEVVIEQGPDPGVKKEPGQTIRIYLGDKSEIND